MFAFKKLKNIQPCSDNFYSHLGLSTFGPFFTFVSGHGKEGEYKYLVFEYPISKVLCGEPFPCRPFAAELLNPALDGRIPFHRMHVPFPTARYVGDFHSLVFSKCCRILVAKSL